MSVAGVAWCPVRPDPIHSRGYCNNRPGESILFYVSVAGSVIRMRVLESESIASVKLRIQTSEGFAVKNQKLVCGGRELTRNGSLLKDYGVKGGNVLHLVLKLSDLLLITVRTSCGKELELHVNRNRNIGYLKQRIARKGKGIVAVDKQEIFFNGEKIDDQKLIDDLCTYNDAVIHLVVQKSANVQAKHVEKDLELSVVAESEVKLPSFMWDMIHSTFDGLEIGNQPIRSLEGTGGTYFMQYKLGLDYVSIFKPIDEEPMAVNNPQGLPPSTNGKGLKRGTRVGEGAVREVAAYILDHPKNGPRYSSGDEMMGFAGVPPTCMVQCLHKGFNHPDGFQSAPENVKVGSLQMFMKNTGSCEDVGPGCFPVAEVHKISVFDIRTANADRHAGNILIGKGEDGQTVLIPIDHGYCLPENFEDCTFDWVYWPQSRKPYSPDTINYIKSLDAEQDIALLKYYGWDVPVECARTLRISTLLLQKGAERGLTPFTIGSIMCRETVNKESVIEQIVREAQDSLLPGMSESAFMESVSQVMDSWLDKLTN
ncbi:Phosphatidylinositol 4-kinase gamma 3 [Hibiscus syriacus]|uniref:1-phosphatidylinositol 4-kinase n=1 Tax=Hibiscus syriacus TaxID=106335 RepID=A0A6A3AYI3_HIBSY|nr:Phosphatidylinositol 4-kinase gamma 3 [Hibiscus syriacus]